MNIWVVELPPDLPGRHRSANGLPGLAAVQAAAHPVHFRAGPYHPVVGGVYRHAQHPGEAHIGALVGKLGVELRPRPPAVTRAKDGAWARSGENGIGLHRIERHGPDGLAAEGRGNGLEGGPTVIAAVDTVVRACKDHFGVLRMGREGEYLRLVPHAPAPGPALATVVGKPDASANCAYHGRIALSHNTSSFKSCVSRWPLRPLLPLESDILEGRTRV